MSAVVVMEYADKGDLLDYLKRRGRLQEHEARWFFQQLIFGLDYCHRRGVVNRDLKLVRCRPRTHTACVGGEGRVVDPSAAPSRPSCAHLWRRAYGHLLLAALRSACMQDNLLLNTIPETAANLPRPLPPSHLHIKICGTACSVHAPCTLAACMHSCFRAVPEPAAALLCVWQRAARRGIASCLRTDALLLEGPGLP